jgi:MFS family permease
MRILGLPAPRSAAEPELASSLWALPGYGLFYLGATLGRLASEMLSIAAVLLVLDRTGSLALASATVAAASLPSVLTGPLLGAWLDRTRRRRAALAANQALLAATLAGMLLAAGRTPGWALPALAALGGLTAPLLTGGVTSMIPLLVPPPLLPHANAMEAASFNSAAVVGPALAGAAAAWFGPASAVGLQGAIALAALAAVARMPAVGPVHPPAEGTGTRSFAGALRAGLAHLARTPVLRAVTVTSVIDYGAQGLLPLALPLLSEQLGAGRAGAGYLFAAVEVGAIAGAFLAVRLAASWPPERIVMGGTAVLAVGDRQLGAGPVVSRGPGAGRPRRPGRRPRLRRAVQRAAAVHPGGPARPDLHHRRQPQDRRLRPRRRPGRCRRHPPRPPRRHRPHRRRRADRRPQRPPRRPGPPLTPVAPPRARGCGQPLTASTGARIVLPPLGNHRKLRITRDGR